MLMTEKLIAAFDRYDTLLHKHITEDISERNDPELVKAAAELNKTANEATQHEAKIIDALKVNPIKRGKSNLKSKIVIKVDTKALDEAIGKTDRLIELLQEVLKIVDSICETDSSKGGSGHEDLRENAEAKKAVFDSFIVKHPWQTMEKDK